MEDFLKDLPVQYELASRHLFIGNVNLLEHWYYRLGDWINLINILRRQFEESESPEEIIESLASCGIHLRIIQQNFDDALTENEYVGNLGVRATCPNKPAGSDVQGRPRKHVIKEDIESLFRIHRNWKLVANVLGVSEKTLQRRRRELGLQVADRAGPRVTYTAISQEALCQVVQEVLTILPNAGETYIIGACKSRGIFVQRQRVRNAIQTVDLMSRALRRTVSIIRRVYSVPGANALW